ncbi:Gldg family protein [Phormidium yuhuli AB48]|uniref:Gldg family protein n=1 Tax=Phormidium yuhuli AB48 TaxID=2940671 RepID=A0ABY5ATR2_9CYAN|nr:Gldg family protein [Phormidium yuhuli]USR92151.1 Gldg family protein [Phormidium yuhuli AB48]
MVNRFKKYWHFLLWVGLFLSVAGLTSGAVSGSWTPVPAVLIVAGIISLGIWLIYLEVFQQGFWRRRSTEAGTNALFATAAVVLILALLNGVAVRASVRVDLTETQRFTLADQTQTLIQNLEEPVTVWLFTSQPNERTLDLLRNYRRLAPDRFNYQLVNPQESPGLVQRFNVTSVGDVFLELGEQRQYVTTLDLEPLSEAQLTRSIAQLQGGDRLTVYMLQGHGQPAILEGGEDSISRAVRALEESAAVVNSLNLIEQGRVPEDANLVAIVGPTSRLFEPEVEALEDYLAAGGSLLVLVDPNTDPGLDGLLEDWGIGLDERIAIDPERWVQGFGPAAPLVFDYGTHPITEGFGRNYTIFPVARPIEYDTVAGVDVTPLLFTSDGSWAEADIDEGPNWEFNPERDRPGPLVLGVAASRQISRTADAPEPEMTETPNATPENVTENNDAVEDSGEAEVIQEGEDIEEAEPPLEDLEATEGEDPQLTETDEEVQETPEADEEVQEDAEEMDEPEEPDADTREARLVVIGDSDFMTDAFFDGQLNSDFFLNSVSWLAEDDDTGQTLTIRPREVVDRNIIMTPRIARLLSWTALVTFPVIGFATSAVLWWTRR